MFFYHILKLLVETYPDLKNATGIVLYDSAADDAELKIKIKKELGLNLKTSLNPRAKKNVTKDLPRGMQNITPYGNVICLAGKEMDYQGIRYSDEKYIYGAPKLEDGKSACTICPQKNECCPKAQKGRIVTIAFDLMPHINPNDPPMAKRFKAMMKLRPSVERMIKTIKCDLADSQLKVRGNLAFQAYLDKILVAYHYLLRP